MSEEFNTPLDGGTTDDFGFDFDFDGNEPAATPEPQAPQQPQIDPNEIQTLKQELQALRRWKEDANQFFGGRPQANPDEQIGQMTPAQFAEHLREQLKQELSTEMQTQQLANEYRQKYPEYAPYESYIAVEIQLAAQKAQQEGKYMGPREAFEAGLQAFKSKFPQLQHMAKAQSMQLQTLKLDPSGAQPSQEFDVDRIPNEKWEQFYEARLRKARGY